MARGRDGGSGFLRSPETNCMLVVTVGIILVVLSLFIDRWRVDPNGMQNWTYLMGTDKLSFFGLTFDSRTYGLIYVKGLTRTTWRAQTQTTCTYRDVNAIVSVGTAIVEILKQLDFGACKNTANDLCYNLPTTHLTVRCEEYADMERSGIITLAFSFVGILMALASILMGCQCKKARVGGVVFALQIIGGIIVVAFNIVWAVRSDIGFKRIMQSAWYPYPSLGVGYYLHLFGGLFLLAGAIFYGINVIPVVMAYDPIARAIERREKKLMEDKIKHHQMYGAPQQQQPQMQPQQQLILIPAQQQPEPMIVAQHQQPLFLSNQQPVGVAPLPMMQQQPATFVPHEREKENYQMPPAPPAF